MSEKLLDREDVLRIAREVEFMGPDCWLTSGAALVLFGVRETTHDVDLVCTRELADRLEAEGYSFHRDGLDNTRIFTVSDQVEVLEDWETEEIVEIEGLRSASLMSIRKQKAALGRDKDLKDIALIDKFMEENRDKA